MVARIETLLDVVRSGGGSAVVDGSTWRSADLLAAARRAAGGLRSRGVQRGDSVMLVDDGSGGDILAALLGVWWVGARVAVLAETVTGAQAVAISRELGAALVIQQGRGYPGSSVSFVDLMAADMAASRTQSCEPDDIALDIASSGTTGHPKCVSYDHKALCANVRAYAERLRLTASDVLYTSLPLSVAGVLGMVLLPGLLAGATTHLGRLVGAQLAHAARQVGQVRPTMMYGVPYTFDFLARQRAGRPGDQLRWAVCSSAPLPETSFDRVRDYLGVPPRSSYCLAEAGTVTLNTSDDLENLRHSVGEPLAGVQVIVEPVADQRAGRLVVSGTSCGRGYRRGGVLEPFAEGRVRTNDLGFFDGASLTVTGRMDEVIQVAGHNVDLAHIRQVVSRCPGLGDFAVVIDRHEHLGKVPILLAEARSLTVDPRDVLRFCRDELPDVELPREIRVVERIERSNTGKVRLAGPQVLFGRKR